MQWCFQRARDPALQWQHLSESSFQPPFYQRRRPPPSCLSPISWSSFCCARVRIWVIDQIKMFKNTKSLCQNQEQIHLHLRTYYLSIILSSDRFLDFKKCRLSQNTTVSSVLYNFDRFTMVSNTYFRNLLNSSSWSGSLSTTRLIFFFTSDRMTSSVRVKVNNYSAGTINQYIH